jgi:hypothetical protein
MRPLISAFHKEQNANSSSAGAFLCVCYFQAAKYPRGINMINSDSNVIMTAVEKFYLSLVVVEAFFLYIFFSRRPPVVCVCVVLCVGCCFVIVRAFHAALFLCQCCGALKYFYINISNRELCARLAGIREKEIKCHPVCVYVDAFKIPHLLVFSLCVHISQAQSM